MANYLYNGVELPQLPDWDKSTYPYALITLSAGDYTLYCAAFTCYHKGSYLYTSTSGKYICFIHNGGTWTQSTFPSAVQSATGGKTFVQCVGNSADYLVWCNYDVMTADGALYLSGSNPVDPSTPVEPEPTDLKPVYRFNSTSWIKMTAFEMQLVDGVKQWVKISEGEKVPIAYSYNGVELPPLPEWDKEKYPYAVITTVPAFGPQMLYCTNNAPYYNESQNTANVDYVAGTEYRNYYPKDGEWAFYKTTTWAGNDSDGLPIIWSSRDVLRENGTLYLAASEPVPIYE